MATIRSLTQIVEGQPFPFLAISSEAEGEALPSASGKDERRRVVTLALNFETANYLARYAHACDSNRIFELLDHIINHLEVRSVDRCTQVTKRTDSWGSRHQFPGALSLQRYYNDYSILVHALDGLKQCGKIRTTRHHGAQSESCMRAIASVCFSSPVSFRMLPKDVVLVIMGFAAYETQDCSLCGDEHQNPRRLLGHFSTDGPHKYSLLFNNVRLSDDVVDHINQHCLKKTMRDMDIAIQIVLYQVKHLHFDAPPEREEEDEATEDEDGEQSLEDKPSPVLSIEAWSWINPKVLPMLESLSVEVTDYSSSLLACLCENDFAGKRLVSLTLSDIEKNDVPLDNIFAKCSRLESLDISMQISESMVDAFVEAKPRQLKSLDINYPEFYYYMGDIVGSCPNLTDLTINITFGDPLDCWNTDDGFAEDSGLFKALSKHQKLKNFVVTGGSMFQKLAELPIAPNIEHISMANFTVLAMSNICKAKKLRTLKLYGFGNFVLPNSEDNTNSNENIEDQETKEPDIDAFEELMADLYASRVRKLSLAEGSLADPCDEILYETLQEMIHDDHLEELTLSASLFELEQMQELMKTASRRLRRFKCGVNALRTETREILRFVRKKPRNLTLEMYFRGPTGEDRFGPLPRGPGAIYLQ